MYEYNFSYSRFFGVVVLKRKAHACVYVVLISLMAYKCALIFALIDVVSTLSINLYRLYLIQIMYVYVLWKKNLFILYVLQFDMRTHTQKLYTLTMRHNWWLSMRRSKKYTRDGGERETFIKNQTSRSIVIITERKYINYKVIFQSRSSHFSLINYGAFGSHFISWWQRAQKNYIVIG